MQKTLSGKKIAIMAANGFNETDMTQGQRALLEAGAKLTVISNQNGLINSWNGSGWGLNFTVDAQLGTVLAADFDMLFVPGGERSLNKLSETAHTKRIVRGFMDAGKPMALQGEAIKLLEMSDRALAGNVVSGKDNAEFVSQMLDSFAGVADNTILEAA